MDASGAVRWIVGFALLTAVGCGESSSPPTSPDPSTEQVERLPRLPRPTVQTELFVGAANDTARAARSVIRGQVQRVNLEFGRAAQAIQSLSAKPYQEIASGEFLFEQSGGTVGCVSSFRVAPTAGALLWTWNNEGLCGESLLTPREIWRLQTSLDGSIGQFDELWIESPGGPGRAHDARVTWEITPSRSEWRSLLRSSAPEHFVARFSSEAEGDDRTRYELERAATFRWRLSLSRDGRSGSFRRFDWSPAADWRERESIVWSPDHGTWTLISTTGVPQVTSW